MNNAFFSYGNMMLNKPLFVFFILTVFILGIVSAQSPQNDGVFNKASAVILQYHHVSDTTPESTSISPEKFEEHLNWLTENNFLILALPDIIKTLKKSDGFSHDKVVAITFDDANRSVCDIAWPVLKQRQIPFTLFISTESVNQAYQSQCSWSQLREMSESGLMTAANHSHQHLNMISSDLSVYSDKWKQAMQEDILKAQSLLEDKLGSASRLFAYPFGEYNSVLTKLVSDLGFTGFGQHSGAIGHHSDFSALPRFPASGQFANLDTLKTKLLSLAFPAQFLASASNPIHIDSADNPPVLTLVFSNSALLKSTRCYNSMGHKLPTSIENNELKVSAADKLDIGRHRYTCTSKSPIEKRFYWLSHQWLIEGNKQHSFSSMLNRIFQ